MRPPNHPTIRPGDLPTESHKAQSHPGRVSRHISEGCEAFTAPVVPVGPAPVEVGGAVHGQAGDAVQEVSEGEVDDEDGGVLERGDVEPQYPVGLSPGNGSQGEEVASSSNDGDDNTAGYN